MSQTAIPLEFERYLQNQISVGDAPDMNEMIFAHIPGLDPSQPINRENGLPDVSLWVHQQDIDQVGKLGDNALAYSAVIPGTVAEFTFNAIYLRDKHVPNSCGMVVHKAEETKENGMASTKSLVQAYDGAAQITGITVDASTWQIDYQARLKGIEEDHRLACLDNYGHTSFVDGFEVTQQADPNKYKVTPGIVYVGGLRGVLTGEVLQIITTKPNGLYVDVVRQGTELSVWENKVTIVDSKTELADYVDEKGNNHYVAKLADIEANGDIIDSRVNNTYKKHGLGVLSPSLLDSFDSLDKKCGETFRTDATTSGEQPISGVNGVVRYERWGENDFIMFFWPATLASSVTYVRRWKKGPGFTAWEKNFSSENLMFASQSDSESGEDNEKVVTPLNVHQAFNQYGLGVKSPVLLDNFNSLDKPNGAIFKTDSSTSGDSPTPGLNGVVRYERWGDNDFIMYYWVASQPSSITWVRRWKIGSGFTSWEQVFSTENLTPYESTTLFYNLNGVGDGTTIDWSSSGKVLDDFKALRVSGFFITGSYKHHIAITLPIDIVKSILGGNDCLYLGGFTAKGSSNSDARVTLVNITQSQATVDILAQTYTAAITCIEGISY